MADHAVFKPTKYQATCCGSVIWSTYSGEFVSCKCGKSFVDQTEFYIRGGGTITPYTEPKESNWGSDWVDDGV